MLIKSLFASVAATVLLAAVVGSASAGRLSSSSSTFRSTFSALTFEGAFGRLVCAVTLEGSLHSRTIAKVTNVLHGFINRADLGACATGSTTILRETLPWHVRYASFSGTLPSITAIGFTVIGYSFQWREPLFTCLARSTEARPVRGTFTREVGGVLTAARISGTVPTSCGIEGGFESNSGTVTVAGAATRVTVTLI
jgi:hypothetical protein